MVIFANMKKITVKWSLFLGILVLAMSTPMRGMEVKDYKVLTMRDGLPDNTVSSLYKDRDGFIWFGTRNGLCKYDGVHISSFSDPEKYVYVRQIQESPNGYLWLIGNNTLQLFNRYEETFIPVVWQDSEDWIYRIHVVNDTTAWILESNRISKMQLKLSTQADGLPTYEAVRLDAITGAMLGGEAMNNMLLLNESTLLITTQSGKLLFYDVQTHHVVKTVRWAMKGGQGVGDLKYINNAVWIGTVAEGLFQYAMDTDSVSHYTYATQKDQSFLSHTDVYHIVPMSDRGVLVTTWNGCTLFTPQEQNPFAYETSFLEFGADVNDVETRMLCAYCDKDGNVWIGTFGGGVVQTTLRQPFYKQYRQPAHNEICQMALDGAGYLWLATFHKGVMKSQEPFHPNREMAFQEAKGFPSSRTFLSLIKDKEGTLWFGGEKGVLLQYAPEVSPDPVSYPGLPAQCAVWCLFEDNQNRFWVGTSSGLFLLDRAKRTYTPYVKGVIVKAIAQDERQQLWLGTTDGLRKMATDGTRAYAVSDGYETALPLVQQGIRALLVHQHNLYVGYENGLSVVDVRTDSIQAFYTTRNGLCSNFITCLTKDHNNRLWVGSNSGLSLYNEKQQLFYHYYISRNNRSVLVLDHCLLWGNNKSITSFDPDLLDSEFSASPNHTFITQLEVYHEAVQVGQKINGQVILQKALAYTSQITLNHKNYRFAVAFSDLSYDKEVVRFTYRLTPFENRWNMAEEGQKIAFAHLKKGKYVLEVRAMAPNGNLGETTYLEVNVLPHWSQSLGAYLVYLLVALLATAAVVLRIKKQRDRKKQEARLHEEMEKINQEREQEKIIHQERTHFFTSVSHELRTPLSLILAPLQEFMANPRIPVEVRPKLALIDKNAGSLSEMVNQLLFLQKAESGMATLQCVDTDIVPLVQDVVADFADMITIRHFKLTTEYACPDIRVNMDPKRMASAIRNVLSNAIKYTPDHGRIHIKVFQGDVLECPCCRISITDNGPGIKKEYVKRVFDSFITTTNEPAFSTRMGIGLKMVKNTMDLHHGHVDLETEEGKGCCFTLSIPLGKAHFAEDKKGEALTHHPIQEENKHKKLLIIEDNADMQAYLLSLFEDSYQVFQAANGEAGLQLALETIPHLIICDVMMPIMDGFACCQALKSNPSTSHIPIILLTARAEDSDILKGTRNGVDDYVMKPFNPEVLAAKVSNLIQQRELLKRIYAKALLVKEIPVPEEKEGDSPFLQKVINVIEMHLSDSDFGVTHIAEALCMSQPTLYRKIKAETQLSVIQIIRNVRISKAAALLLEKKYSVQEVAEKVGYNDLRSFRKHFTEQFGVQPSKF